MTFDARASGFLENHWMRLGLDGLCWLWSGLWLVLALGSVEQGGGGTVALCLAHAASMAPPVTVAARNRGLRGVRKAVAWFSAVGFIVLAVLGVSGEPVVRQPPVAVARLPAAQPATPQLLTLAHYRAKVPSHAVIEIDRGFYPELYAALGAARVADANRLAPWVALRVALSPRCDQVDLVEMAADASRADLRWFADCANRERFYVDEAEAKATRADLAGLNEGDSVALTVVDLPRSESVKVELFDEGLAVSRCETAMQALLQASGSYRPAGAWRTTLHPQRGRATVIRSFTAKNAFNARLNSQWDCLIDAGDMSIVELKYLDGEQWRSVSR